MIASYRKRVRTDEQFPPNSRGSKGNVGWKLPTPHLAALDSEVAGLDIFCSVNLCSLTREGNKKGLKVDT